MSPATKSATAKACLESNARGIYDVSGVLNMQSVMLLANQAQSCFQAGQNLVFNFKNIEHSDSAGLALILGWVVTARKKNIDIVLKNVPKQLLAIARASDLVELLPVQQG